MTIFLIFAFPSLHLQKLIIAANASKAYASTKVMHVNEKMPLMPYLKIDHFLRHETLTMVNCKNAVCFLKKANNASIFNPMSFEGYIYRLYITPSIIKFNDLRNQSLYSIYKKILIRQHFIKF